MVTVNAGKPHEIKAMFTNNTAKFKIMLKKARNPVAPPTITIKTAKMIIKINVALTISRYPLIFEKDARQPTRNRYRQHDSNSTD